MREAGDVCYADVQKDGMGMVEYLRKEDMEYALRKLDDTKFRSHEVGPHLLLSLYQTTSPKADLAEVATGHALAI